MNQQTVKLLRPILPTKQEFRRFKKAYTEASVQKKKDILKTARRIKAGGPVRYVEIPNARD